MKEQKANPMGWLFAFWPQGALRQKSRRRGILPRLAEEYFR